MAIINSISIENLKNIKTCEDFANAFINHIIVESQGFSEVRVIFDIYLDISLKSTTRNDRTNDTKIQNEVNDCTIIKHLKTSNFVPHTQTKKDLTAHLSQKLETALTKANISNVISYQTNA